tara:strand:+ start:596 stop:853 length:258 start_codon:yes stop_codon:yes gene_type:complete
MKHKQLEIALDPVVYGNLEHHRHKLKTDKFYVAKHIADVAIANSNIDEWLVDETDTRAVKAKRLEEFHLSLMRKIISIIDQKICT